MRSPVRSFAASPILCLAAGLWSEATGIDVVTDPACFHEAVGPVTRIDFEGLPRRSSSCPGPSKMPLEKIPNPLVIEGVTFSAPQCLMTGSCGGCDPDVPEERTLLMMHQGASIDLPVGTTGILLESRGTTPSSFTLRAVDTAGDTAQARGWHGILHQVRDIGFISPRGLSRIEVLDLGERGWSLMLAAVDLGKDGKPIECGFPDGRRDLLEPAATGTIRFLPEMALREMAPVERLVQSTYWRHTSRDREFRRGILEFQVPPLSSVIESAVLVLEENSAVFAAVHPPLPHEIHSYEADLSVDVDDHERAASFLASIETLRHIAAERFVIDIRELLEEFRGKALGFRVQLAVDPEYSAMDEMGDEFSFAWIEVELGTAFKRGDADENGITNISDAISVLEFLFLRQPEGVFCLRAADTDDSGRLDISDPIGLLLHLFAGGPPPRAPFPDCGADRTPDDLGCSSPACP